FGQGISALGGENISYRNINIGATHGAGVFIGTIGAPFFTQPTTGVTVTGGTVNGANASPESVMGAIAVYGTYAGNTTSNVTISDLDVSNIPPSAAQNIAVWLDQGGSVSNVAFRNIAIHQSNALPVLVSNAPPESYKMSGVTLNGTPHDTP
ncbi:MAG: hypothetical protein QOH57_1878, partial [Mycobacterium sp.]|nr:hypothetical protein [Mycobacterium sp.]